jgi:16S rRNA (guanine527-N7)-methyltransferase
MQINEFKEKMNENLKQLNIELSDIQLKQFYQYMNILIEWNKFMNLTGITEPEEVITKLSPNLAEILPEIPGV